MHVTSLLCGPRPIYGRFMGYYRIPKISPGAHQKPFLRGLFLEARREICISRSIMVACSGKEIYHVCFVLLCIRGQIPSTSPPGGLYSEGRFNECFLRYDFGGLIFGGAYFRNFTVFEIYKAFQDRLTFLNRHMII